MRMNTNKIYLTVFFLVVLLPFAGQWARRATTGCTYDGMKIEPVYRVRIVDESNHNHDFCCIGCARLWLKQGNRLTEKVFVTDESTGQEIPAATAVFVRSLVITMPASGSRIHAFQNLVDAQKHARTFRGTILEKTNNPL